MVIFTTLIFVVLGLTLIMLLTFATNKLTSQQAGLFLITYTKDICPSNCDLENIESNKDTNDVVEISMETIYNNALANLNEKLKKVIVWGVLGFTVLSIFVSLWFGNKISQPINKMIQSLSRDDHGHFEKLNFQSASTKEIAELQTAIDKSLKKFDEELEAQKRLALNTIHELNTPVALITIAIERLRKKRGGVVDNLNKEISALEQATNRLNKILKQVEDLDIAKHDLEKQPINLPSFVSKTIDLLTNIALRRNIKIKLEFSGVETLYSIEAWLQSVLINLLDNAIKYSHDNSTVNVSVQNNDTFCKFEIQDTGIGISEENLSHITERFFRVDKSRSLTSEGAGLGLSITADLVEKMNGKLSFRSELGKGTTATVYIPNANLVSSFKVLESDNSTKPPGIFNNKAFC